jgi:hypothetical protein
MYYYMLDSPLFHSQSSNMGGQEQFKNTPDSKRSLDVVFAVTVKSILQPGIVTLNTKLYYNDPSNTENINV